MFNLSAALFYQSSAQEIIFRLICKKNNDSSPIVIHFISLVNCTICK